MKSKYLNFPLDEKLIKEIKTQYLKSFKNDGLSLTGLYQKIFSTGWETIKKGDK